jgi:hypothetical protein
MDGLRSREEGLQGITFGAMDAIINVLGIVVGLGVMGNRTAVFVGILVAGVANSLGNAWGFHVSEETEDMHTRREVWMATGMAFLGTFAVTFVLIAPLLLFPLQQAIAATTVMGIGLIIAVGVLVSRVQGLGTMESARLVLEYVGVSMLVIFAAFVLGTYASEFVM